MRGSRKFGVDGPAGGADHSVKKTVSPADGGARPRRSRPSRRTSTRPPTRRTSVEGGPPASTPPSTTAAVPSGSSRAAARRIEHRRLAAPVGAGGGERPAEAGEQPPQAVVGRDPDRHRAVRAPPPGRRAGTTGSTTVSGPGQSGSQARTSAGAVRGGRVDAEGGDLRPVGGDHRQRLGRVPPLQPVDPGEPFRVPGSAARP